MNFGLPACLAVGLLSTLAVLTDAAAEIVVGAKALLMNAGEKPAAGGVAYSGAHVSIGESGAG